MKTRFCLWVSLCWCLSSAGLAVLAADKAAAGSAVSQTAKPSDAAVNTGANVATSTNAVEAQAVLVVRSSVSVYKTKIAEKKPQLLRHRKYTGPLYAVFTSKEAYQMINPFAPARYGNGFDNMPRDPSTDKPAGITLIAIHD